MREYKEMYKYEQYKEARSHSKRTLEPNKGAWKDGALDGLLEIHATAAPLWSATGRIHMLQAPEVDMRIQRSQNSPASGDAKARWRA